MTTEPRDILVIGYGNPGRADDGLGPALAGAIEERGLPHVTVDIDYQLTVEHALAIARHAVVIFVDASVEGDEPFTFQPLVPTTEPSIDFTSHSLAPRNLLALARDLFDARADAYCLAVRGYRFDEFREGLSLRAGHNMKAALDFLAPLLNTGRFRRSVTPVTCKAARLKEIEPCPATNS